MNNRGIVFVFALLVVLIMSILVVSFFVKSASENQMANKYANSLRALWLAEAGIAKVKSNTGMSGTSGYIDNPNHTYSVSVNLISGTVNYYNVVSTGTVIVPGGENVQRVIQATIKTNEVDSAKFKYGIETTTDLIVRGSVDINPDNSWKEFSVLDFADLFGLTKSEMRDSADHLYSPADFPAAINGVTWVDVPTGSTLTIAGSLAGSGILVVNGETHFSGTVDFNGIIYVIGKLTMTGTVVTNGSVLVESTTTVDTILRGNVTVNYSVTDINNALDGVRFLTKEIVSWREQL